MADKAQTIDALLGGVREQDVVAGQLEALLFAAAEPVTLERMAEACQISAGQILSALKHLSARYEASGSALQIVDVAGGKQLRTRPEYHDTIARLRPVRPAPLSTAALESLAIVLYKQPVTRLQIDTIRGVNSISALHSLLERNLIREAGRLDAPGRPMLYETTPQALVRLGLASLDDLPPLEGVGSEPDQVRLPME